DITVRGRADHAGATPMGFRLDPTIVVAECVLELERLAHAAGRGTGATVGEIELEPGLVNAVASQARFSIDGRGGGDDAVTGGVDDDACTGVAERISLYWCEVAEARATTVEYTERQRLPATPLDPGVVEALAIAAEASGEPWSRMPSGAAHDTMCVAPFVPSA